VTYRLVLLFFTMMWPDRFVYVHLYLCVRKVSFAKIGRMDRHAVCVWICSDPAGNGKGEVGWDWLCEVVLNHAACQQSVSVATSGECKRSASLSGVARWHLLQNEVVLVVMRLCILSTYVGLNS